MIVHYAWSGYSLRYEYRMHPDTFMMIVHTTWPKATPQERNELYGYVLMFRQDVEEHPENWESELWK